MRTLKLQVQTTIDGYMAGPVGGMDWLAGPWTDDINTYVDTLWEAVDCIVLGRKLAEGFIPTWAAGPEGETQESIDQMNNTPKVVISNSLAESPWDNAVVAGGDLTETITKLKAQEGGDLMVCGGGTLVADLIARNLVDELHLFVNPTAIGAGMPVFPDTGANQPFSLIGARTFACGITALHYQPTRP